MRVAVVGLGNAGYTPHLPALAGLSSVQTVGAMDRIEPNPPEYGCDYVMTSVEGAALVRSLGTPGLGLHLDAAAMALAGEPAAPAIHGAATVLRHFHASEPFLAPLGSGRVDHRELGAALARVDYQGWVSLEMRHVSEDVTGSLRAALGILRDCYGSSRWTGCLDSSGEAT